MPLIAQTIASIYDGVSQQPDKLRTTGQSQSQLNVFDSMVYGKIKRPPTTHVAKLGSGTWVNPYIFAVNRDSVTKYHVVVAGGTCYVFDGITGASYTVLTPKGSAYLTLAPTVPPAMQSGFRFTQVQDTTFIVNQTISPQPLQGAATEPAIFEALVTVALGDYGTNYYVTINNITAGFQATNPNSPVSRAQLSTDQMAQQLYDSFTSNATLNGQFNFTLLGTIGSTQGASTLYVTRKDGADFQISASDGLNDGGIVVVKGTVQNIENLPARARNGMVVQVAPDPDNKYDVTYYVYDNLGSVNLAGIWREAAAPGILTTLDPATMPWQLQKGGDLVNGFPAAGNPPPPIIGQGGITTSYEDGNFNNKGVWAVGTSYVAGVYISYLGKTYLSLVNANLGNIPSSSPTDWQIDTSVEQQRLQLTQDSESYTLTLYTLDGSHNEIVTFYYDVDAGNLPTGQFIQVNIHDVGLGINYPQVFAGGTNVLNFPQVIPTNGSSGDEFIVTLNYSIGSTPKSSVAASVTLHAPQDPSGFNSVQVQIPRAISITWNSDWTYPAGVGINVQLVGLSTQTFTPATDSTADQVATLAAALNFSGGSYTGSVLDGNTTLYTKNPGLLTSALVSYNWSDLIQYYNADLQLAPGELVGYTFQDLTDGSSGIITANSVNTITFSSGLSGGTSNIVHLNDLVAVNGPEDVFVLQPVNWTTRNVGDDLTNPFPSLTYDFITEVGFTSGRLVLLSGENVICSGSDDIFNLFRTTVTQLLDGDRIDISANSGTVSDWHSLVHWAEGAWLFAGNVQAQLPTDPALANSSVSIQSLTIYQSQPTMRPLGMDRRVFFTRLRSPNSAAPVTEVMRYMRARFPLAGFFAESITKHIPTYLAGTPLQLVGDPQLELVVLLTSAVPNQLYPYKFVYDQAQDLQMESWSTWQLDPGCTILAMDFLDGVLGLIIQRSDGVYLEYLDCQVALYESPS
jgi:hypothetical protein